MSKQDEYRQFAADALNMARNAADRDSKTRLLNRAEAWLNLADRTGHLTKKRQPPTARASASHQSARTRSGGVGIGRLSSKRNEPRCRPTPEPTRLPLARTARDTTPMLIRR
jgi:hypothetical protein